MRKAWSSYGRFTGRGRAVARKGWTPCLTQQALTRIRNLPDEALRERIGREIEQLCRHPWGTHSGVVRGPEHRERKIRRILVEQWRVVCVLLPERREVHVVDVFKRSRKSGEDYSIARIRRWLRLARRNPSNEIGAHLMAHPDWSDRRIATAAGCSPTTVFRYRAAAGMPARHTVEWEPWRSRWPS